MAQNDMTFAEMLKRLEQIADILDGGEASLEDSLKLFEEASGLIRKCNSCLSAARLKITDISDVKEVENNG